MRDESDVIFPLIKWKMGIVYILIAKYRHFRHFGGGGRIELLRKHQMKADVRRLAGQGFWALTEHEYGQYGWSPFFDQLARLGR